MKTLMLHVRSFEVEVVKLATRPKGIKPEKLNDKNKKQVVKNAILCFICVEKGDFLEKNSKTLFSEIISFVNDVKHNNVVIFPFAHLSNKLANYKEGIKFFDLLEKELKNKVNIFRSHFGSDKEWKVDVYGHIGAVRFREF